MVPLSVEFSTPRLRIVPLGAELFELFAQDRGLLEDRLGLVRAHLLLPDELNEEMAQTVPLVQSRLKAHPRDWLWYTMWQIILASERRIIGGMGFAAPPDAAGEVVAGYWIDQAYHGRGYMSEALGALVAWAFHDPRVQRIAANTPAQNLASQRVLVKHGFVRAGEREGHPLFVLDRPVASGMPLRTPPPINRLP